MLTSPDLSTPNIWTGLRPEGPWQWAQRGTSVHRNKFLAIDAFELVDVITVAAREHLSNLRHHRRQLDDQR